MLQHDFFSLVIHLVQARCIVGVVLFHRSMKLSFAPVTLSRLPVGFIGNANPVRFQFELSTLTGFAPTYKSVTLRLTIFP